VRQSHNKGWFRDLVPRFVSFVTVADLCQQKVFKVRFFRCPVRFPGWVALGLLLVGASCIAAPESYTARATRVSDGDTLWVQPSTGGAPRKLRLHGVDAPEICQNGGGAAREALLVLVQNRTLSVRVKYQDDYGRGLAHIEVNGQDVAATMVRLGHAWSYRWRRKHRRVAPGAACLPSQRPSDRQIFAAAMAVVICLTVRAASS